jgi:hypothetical protein
MLPPTLPRTALSLGRMTRVFSDVRHTAIGGSQFQTLHLFSTQQVRHSERRSENTQQRPISDKLGSKPASQGPLATLDKLGATRTVKVVIIIFISILGTMETIFWFNAAWRYFYPPSDVDTSEEIRQK